MTRLEELKNALTEAREAYVVAQDYSDSVMDEGDVPTFLEALRLQGISLDVLAKAGEVLATYKEENNL